MSPRAELWLKSGLIFTGLLCKGLATSHPLHVAGGQVIHDIAGIVWPAFDGAFFWLLKSPITPPTTRKRKDVLK